ADGCVVLLCLAAPSWRAIPQCVPPIRQLFRDLARGRGGRPGHARKHGGDADGLLRHEFLADIKPRLGEVQSHVYIRDCIHRITSYSDAWGGVSRGGSLGAMQSI
ncbi:MAG: hypothetical protein EOP02_25220, partial [Proteobacteria bacterium]